MESTVETKWYMGDYIYIPSHLYAEGMEFRNKEEAVLYNTMANIAQENGIGGEELKVLYAGTLRMLGNYTSQNANLRTVGEEY